MLRHSEDPAVPRVSRPVLLRNPAGSMCTTDSAAVRGQQHAGHRLDCSSETPTDSNVVRDNFFFSFFFLLGVHTSVGQDAAAVRLATWHQSHGNSCSFHSFSWRFCFSNGFNESMRVTLWWSPSYTTQGSTAWLSTLCSPSSSFLSSCFCCSRGEKSCLAHIIPSLNNHKKNTHTQ